MSPPALMDELVEEVLLRLPPGEPAWLVHASAVCKPWRSILAAPRFRRRYREFHGTPPVLGLFQEKASFVPTSALLPVRPDLPPWIALDCRHGFATYTSPSARYYMDPSDFTVLDPLTGHQRRVPFPVGGGLWFSAAVLCATQGCDHHGCEEGHFLVVFVSTFTDELDGVTTARVYSSETGAWSELISLSEPNVMYDCNIQCLSVLLGDAVYFNNKDIIKYQFGTRRLLMFEKPTHGDETLMTAEDRGLGFAGVVDDTNLALWSRDTRHDGAMGWVKLRAIDLKRLLPDGALSTPTHVSCFRSTLVSGTVEGTQVIFVSTSVGCYMVDLKSGRSRKVSRRYDETIFPYTRFYIPAMEAACTDQEQ